MPNPDTSVLKVRRSIHIKATPERVWEAFTSKARMDDWWGLTKGSPEAGTSQGQWLTAFEPRAGGCIEMAVMLDGKRASYGGVIKTFTSAKELPSKTIGFPTRAGRRQPT